MSVCVCVTALIINMRIGEAHWWELQCDRKNRTERFLFGRGREWGGRLGRFIAGDDQSDRVDGSFDLCNISTFITRGDLAHIPSNRQRMNEKHHHILSIAAERLPRSSTCRLVSPVTDDFNCCATTSSFPIRIWDIPDKLFIFLCIFVIVLLSAQFCCVCVLFEIMPLHEWKHTSNALPPPFGLDVCIQMLQINNHIRFVALRWTVPGVRHAIQPLHHGRGLWLHDILLLFCR